MNQFNDKNFIAICRRLALRDKDLNSIIKKHGFPPRWTRPGTFQTLVLIILEQQVSLASAYAAFKKLRALVGYVTPSKILGLSDASLRACYFSRQKIVYVRDLAATIQKRQLNLKNLAVASDEEVRVQLKKVKGIGDWTADVYLINALQRMDIFPIGDLALVKSLKETKKLPSSIGREKMLAVAESWRPYRTIASMILWHSYIQKRGIKIVA